MKKEEIKKYLDQILNLMLMAEVLVFYRVFVSLVMIMKVGSLIQLMKLWRLKFLMEKV